MKNHNKQTLTKALTMLLLVILVMLVFSAGSLAQQDAANDLTSMDINDLMNIEVASSATLTDTKPRLVPSAMTTISADQIKASGARNLFELLDIFVPNFQWIRHHYESDHMGLRGIINDRDDKYLLLVNGRVMNERTHFGALSEKDLVMLRDIHHVDVVRGPGSALYGPGAVSMVINIVTFTGETFQGTEVTGQVGSVYEFYSAEVKHGKKFEDDDGGIFVYAGIGKTVGADQQAAPQVFAGDFPTYSYYSWMSPPYQFFDIGPDGTQAGEPLSGITIPRDGADNRGLPALKLHGQITKGDWDIWARYTRGGKQFTWDGGMLKHHGATGDGAPSWGWGDWSPIWDYDGHIPEDASFNTFGYQQYTGFIGNSTELAKGLELDTSFSYDRLYFMRLLNDSVIDFFREDKYYAKSILKWQVNDKHKIAFGGELLHGEYGFPGTGFPGGDAVSSRLNSYLDPNLTHMPRWSTNLWSIMGEWQWNINEQWTTFLGARVDDHTFTDTMFSPRAAVVYTPTSVDTFKLMWARSVRSNFEEEMKAQDINNFNSSVSEPEKLDSAELRWERQINKNLDIAASGFWYYNLELLSWDSTTGHTAPIATQKTWGVELEASYHTDKTRITASHSYTKLIDFELEPGKDTYLSSKPFGFGDDLANWSNHISKIMVQQKLDDKWSINGSLRIYWGFPGLQDIGEYWASETDPYLPTPDFPSLKPGYDKFSKGSYFLDLGLQYKASKDLLIGVTGYNLLGIFDKDLNKRNFLGATDFRSEAVAVGVSVEYKF